MKPVIQDGAGNIVDPPIGVRVVSDGVRHKVLAADGREMPGVVSTELYLEPGRPALATIVVLAKVDVTSFGCEFQKEEVDDADAG